MSLQPIPSKFLKDSFSLFIPNNTDMFNKTEYETYLVDKVHIQRVNQYINSGNKSINLTATIFVDAIKSKYDVQIMNSLSSIVNNENKKIKVVYDGEDHYINNIDVLPQLDSNKIHHWEINVI